MRRFIAPLFFAFLTPCLAAPVYAASAAAAAWNVGPATANGACLLLSDIHFDPFADSTLVKSLAESPPEAWDGIFARSRLTQLPPYFLADTNWPLWRSTLGALSLPAVPYDYAVITGDILAHNFDKKFQECGLGGQDAYESFILKVYRYLNAGLTKALPSTPLYWAMGNNDADCGDWELTPGGPLLAALSKEWSVVAADPERAKDFASGGYYEAALPGNAGRLIVLNSVAWSPHQALKCGDASKDLGLEELDWLRAKLDSDQAAGRKVTLAMHIPPGLSAFMASCGLPVEAFYRPAYQDALFKILKDHAASLRLLLAGHTHFDDLKVLRDKGKALLGMHLTPSVGPNHGNNPSFEVLLYRRKDGATLDLDTYTLSSPSQGFYGGADGRWALEYDFREAYGQSFDTDGLDQVAKDIQAGGRARELYETYFAGKTPSKAALQSLGWKPYSCAQTCFTPLEFHDCACGR